MSNLSVIVFSLALIANVVKSQDNTPLLSFFKPDVCPSYSAMPGLNLTKIAGVWYDLATTDPFFDDKKCSKNILTINQNGTVTSANDMILINGTPLDTSFEFTQDPSQPNEMFYMAYIHDESIFGSMDRVQTAKFSLVYTDYDNIAVFYSCYDERTNFVTHRNYQVYMETRSRAFDSLAQFEQAITTLVNLRVDFNKLRFVYNGNNCSN